MGVWAPRARHGALCTQASVQSTAARVAARMVSVHHGQDGQGALYCGAQYMSDKVACCERGGNKGDSDAAHGVLPEKVGVT